ncbi:response regulator [Magnetospira sp. QH-2]|uniref:response regulator n=1 Tax=Magnetospira sp. (strain QH-2) TaxID=1288970 RepID=UPI0003E80EB4|nr:response regulator [Magnetospira sp. QH-2]CCQ73808.1 Conserved protein of unknown function. Containing a CheY-like receiver domain [Magnetospira sp. QH-2]
MAGLNLEEIRVFVGCPDQNLRTTTLTVLRNCGFRNVEYGQTIEAVRTEMTMHPPDLLFCETKFPDGDPGSLIHDIRHHEIGSNPFLAVVMMTWEPSVDLVSKIINSGADDLLVKPLSAKQVIQRVGALIKNRKGFMVTSDYIGPDRRRDKERPPEEDNENQIKPIEVPNALRAKALGEADAAEIQGSIDAALKAINSRKLEGHAVKVSELVAHILPAYRQGQVDNTVRQKLHNLVYVAEDTARRLVDTDFSHVADLCNSLVQVSNDIYANWKEPNPKDLKLLEPIAKAIETAFTGSPEQAEMARQITDTVSGRRPG